jgi:hypothetical protein
MLILMALVDSVHKVCGEPGKMDFVVKLEKLEKKSPDAPSFVLFLKHAKRSSILSLLRRWLTIPLSAGGVWWSIPAVPRLMSKFVPTTNKYLGLQTLRHCIAPAYALCARHDANEIASQETQQNSEISNV